MKKAREDEYDVPRAVKSLTIINNDQVLDEAKKLIEEYSVIYKMVDNPPARLLGQTIELVDALTSTDPNKLHDSIHSWYSDLSIPQDKLLDFLTKVNTSYDKGIPEQTLADIAKVISMYESEMFWKMLINKSAIKYGDVSRGLTYWAVRACQDKCSPYIKDAILSEFDHMISKLANSQGEKNEIASCMNDFAKEDYSDMYDTLKVHKKILQLTRDPIIVKDLLSSHRESADLAVRKALSSMKKITLTAMKDDVLSSISNIDKLFLLPDDEKKKYKAKISKAALGHVNEILTSEPFIQVLYKTSAKCLEKFNDSRKDKDQIDGLIRFVINSDNDQNIVTDFVEKTNLSYHNILDIKQFTFKLKHPEYFALDTQCRMYERYHAIIKELEFPDNVKENRDIFGVHIITNPNLSQICLNDSALAHTLKRIQDSFSISDFAEQEKLNLESFEKYWNELHEKLAPTLGKPPHFSDRVSLPLGRLDRLVEYHIKNEIFESKEGVFYEPSMLENHYVLEDLGRDTYYTDPQC